MPKDRHIAIEVFAFERVRDDGLILHAHDIVKTRAAQRENRPFELPGRRVRARHREMPRDVVFENRRRARIERTRAAREFEQSLVILQNGFGLCAENCDFRFCCHLFFSVSSVAIIFRTRKYDHFRRANSLAYFTPSVAAFARAQSVSLVCPQVASSCRANRASSPRSLRA